MQAARNDALTSACVRLALAVLFSAIGGFIVYLAISMVGIFGEGMGVDEKSRWIYSRAHIAVHVFGTASAIAIGLFVLGKSRVLACLAFAAILLCGSYGIINMIGFTTTNRLSVSESREAANSADWKAYEAKRAAIQGEINWTRDVVINEENPREKRRLLSRIDAKLKELEAVPVPKPTAANVLADPQATWFGRVTGWASERWQLALPVPVAVLLFAGEVLSFVFAVHLLLGAIESFRLAGEVSPRKRGRNDDDGGGGGERKKDPEKPAGNISPFPMKDQPKPAVALNLSAFTPPRNENSRRPLDEYLQELLARGRKMESQTAIARVSGWSEPTVSKMLAKWERDGKIHRDRTGNRKVVRQRIGDGGSRQAVAVG